MVDDICSLPFPIGGNFDETKKSAKWLLWQSAERRLPLSRKCSSGFVAREAPWSGLNGPVFKKVPGLSRGVGCLYGKFWVLEHGW